MLNNIYEKKDLSLPIGEASFPHPFAHTLEYNPPVHETWNIVHIGMQVPESMQVYICAENCMRGVIMTAYEMGAEDRFSCVCLHESDIMRGDLENQIITGVEESIAQSPFVPKAVIVFPVCIHKILSTDLHYVYKKLRENHPDIVFCEGYMDPLSQKEGLAPDVRLRYSMYNGVKKMPHDNGVSILGSETSFYDHDDFHDFLKDRPIRQLDQASYQDYLDLGKSALNICVYPAGRQPIEQLSERLDSQFLYLPMLFDYAKIEEESQMLCMALGIDYHSLNLKNECEKALSHLKETIGETEVVIDYVAIPHLLSLARFLLDHGINVTELYLDDLTDEEKEDFEYLRKYYPKLRIVPTTQAGMRFFHESGAVLAIGPKAAFFRDSVHFVNIIEDGGLWGYKGIIRLCQLMEEAFYEEKDPRDYVTRKGLGCECLL